MRIDKYFRSTRGTFEKSVHKVHSPALSGSIATCNGPRGCKGINEV